MFNFFAYRAVYEIMWKNLVEPNRLQMKIWPISIACWVPTTTNAHPECVIIIDFPQ